MTAAILAIVAALVPFAIWLYKRRAANNEDPYHQHELHREQIAKEIIHDDETSVRERFTNLQPSTFNLQHGSPANHHPRTIAPRRLDH